MFYPTLFLIAKILDLLSTKLAISRFGINTEANPIGKWLLLNFGDYPLFILFLVMSWGIFIAEEKASKYKIALAFIRLMVIMSFLIPFYNFGLYFLK